LDSPHTADITELLTHLDGGDPASAERLLTMVYGELRRLARGQLERGPSHATLQPTAPLHSDSRAKTTFLSPLEPTDMSDQLDQEWADSMVGT
jgi:hypothetical protein